MQDALSLRKAIEREAQKANSLDELAARAAAGDSVAFEVIYNETIEDIFSYLMGRLQNRATAEDLAANIFLKAWASARSYRRGSNNYRRWLFAIAHNELRDFWRRERSNLRLAQEQIAEPPQLHEESEAQEMERLVAAAMQGLNEQQRQIVTLRFFSELPHAEIAKLLGKREGAVRAQLLRALRQMRKVIDHAAP